jgi:enoyl-CoA hydratase/carnithine racemase
MSQTYQRLKIVVNANIAEVILSVPKTMNSMDGTFFNEIGRAFRELDKQEDVYVIIIWAEGKIFSAGLDLKKATSTLMPTEDESPAVQNLKFLRLVTEWQDDLTAIEKCRKPVIAAVHGAVIGGAIDMITACDIRLCTQDAKFSIRETKIGLVADLGTLQRITPIVGKGFAREMAYTGSDFDATRAFQNHLVNAVYDTKDALLQGARQLASNIAQNSPLVVQGTKKVLQYAERHRTEEGLNQVALWNSAFIKSDDLGEAIVSFMEKRQPKFKNKL